MGRRSLLGGTSQTTFALLPDSNHHIHKALGHLHCLQGRHHNSLQHWQPVSVSQKILALDSTWRRKSPLQQK